ncbi:MAG: family 1 glycosylhydrolase, partial [Deltaproteobacteria bacterium]|nr:family 1 glycosylhydrolase [Deltaproteobacteria bacterium]
MGAAPRRPKPITFPKGFLWGAATAAQQVEGGNYNNDWYQWELAGKTKDRAGQADDSYHLYDTDFSLAQ